jgi:hypothetical protein
VGTSVKDRQNFMCPDTVVHQVQRSNHRVNVQFSLVLPLEIRNYLLAKIHIFLRLLVNTPKFMMHTVYYIIFTPIPQIPSGIMLVLLTLGEFKSIQVTRPDFQTDDLNS